MGKIDIDKFVAGLMGCNCKVTDPWLVTLKNALADQGLKYDPDMGIVEISPDTEEEIALAEYNPYDDFRKSDSEEEIPHKFQKGDRVRYKGCSCDGVIEGLSDIGYKLRTEVLPYSIEDMLELVERGGKKYATTEETPHEPDLDNTNGTNTIKFEVEEELTEFEKACARFAYPGLDLNDLTPEGIVHIKKGAVKILSLARKQIASEIEPAEMMKKHYEEYKDMITPCGLYMKGVKDTIEAIKGE